MHLTVLHRREKEGKMGCRAARTRGKDKDQPFSFTVGDSGNLWGGITCKSGHETPNHWSDIKIPHTAELFIFIFTLIYSNRVCHDCFPFKLAVFFFKNNLL